MADLLLKNIIVPIELLTHWVHLLVIASPPWFALLLPDFIAEIAFSIASLDASPYNASTLFKFFSLNIISTFSINSVKYSFLFVFSVKLFRSLKVVWANQCSPGFGHESFLDTSNSPSAKALSSGSLATRSFNFLLSLLDKPGISLPALFHKYTRTAAS